MRREKNAKNKKRFEFNKRKIENCEVMEKLCEMYGRKNFQMASIN